MMNHADRSSRVACPIRSSHRRSSCLAEEHAKGIDREDGMVGLRRAFGPLAALLAFSATSTYGQNNGPGVTATEIKTGRRNPTAVPVSAWSIQGRVDLAYMNKINAQGGINGARSNHLAGRRLQSTQSPRAGARARGSERVLGFFGSVGTTPNIAVAKYLNDRRRRTCSSRAARTPLGRPQDEQVVDAILHPADY